MKNVSEKQLCEKDTSFYVNTITKLDRQLYSFACSFFSVYMKSIVTLVH